MLERVRRSTEPVQRYAEVPRLEELFGVEKLLQWGLQWDQI